MIKYLALVALLFLSSSKTFAYSDNLEVGVHNSYLTKDLALNLLNTHEESPDSIVSSEVFHDKALVETTHSNLQIDLGVGDPSFSKKVGIGKRDSLEVPEPFSLILLGIGILCVVKVRRSVNKNQ